VSYAHKRAQWQTFLAMRIFMRIRCIPQLMETPTKKPRRKKVRRSGKPTNLYLNTDVVTEGKALAQTRYGISLSELIERLLRAEMGRKRGKAHTSFGSEASA
jgi:hypothetical protein